MNESIQIPDMARIYQIPRRSYRFDDRPSTGEWYARQAEPLPAREVRGGYQVIGYATDLARSRYDRWRLGRVLIRTNLPNDVTRIEISFYGESVYWEGHSEMALPVYRR
ncbi:hypothetical protein ABTY53_15425 [Streptomyces noursei]|uniref:hypothetical protein n=1 Tax=Streptomyces noursei TaxID=1971 RepID=UPI0033252092